MITLRPYDDRDCAGITAIYAHHVQWGTASFETEPPSHSEMRQRFDDIRAQHYPILVATDAQDMVLGYGYASAHKSRYGYRFTVEDSIYIHHEHTQLGIGSALLHKLIDECTIQGYHQMIAVIGDSENHGSVALHAKAGFEQIGIARHLGFKFGRFIDVVFMQRQLLPASHFTE